MNHESQAMTDEKARDAFEDWFSDGGEYPKDIAQIDGNYRLAAAEYAWSAFQEGWNRQALAAHVSAPGWTVVPVVPTPEMIEAYLKANEAYWLRADELPRPACKWRAGTPKEATAEGYRAMLAAAPLPEGQVKPGPDVHGAKGVGQFPDAVDDQRATSDPSRAR